MFRIIAILLCVVGFSVSAQADELIIHTVSLHSAHNSDSTETSETVSPSGRKTVRTREIPGYNNLNIGFGYRWDSGLMEGLSAGMYYNSYRKPAAYIAREWMFSEHYGAFVGAVTGYRSVTGYEVTPMGGFIIRKSLDKKYTMNVLITPPISKDTDGVAHLTVFRKF